MTTDSTADSTSADATTSARGASRGDDPRFAALPGRPGKIVAVHLSYASRAQQRGRRPSAPSYFFKPSSSVQASGGEIARPRGTELLAFEGEIALVIGRDARFVPLESAWEHVAWVTAANDFGLSDLRANDKGSNVRSKGGDGFTPIGPALIDARSVDPTALRIRAWVNGAKYVPLYMFSRPYQVVAADRGAGVPRESIGLLDKLLGAGDRVSSRERIETNPQCR